MTVNSQLSSSKRLFFHMIGSLHVMISSGCACLACRVFDLSEPHQVNKASVLNTWNLTELYSRSCNSVVFLCA